MNDEQAYRIGLAAIFGTLLTAVIAVIAAVLLSCGTQPKEQAPSPMTIGVDLSLYDKTADELTLRFGKPCLLDTENNVAVWAFLGNTVLNQCMPAEMMIVHFNPKTGKSTGYYMGD